MQNAERRGKADQSQVHARYEPGTSQVQARCMGGTCEVRGRYMGGTSQEAARRTGLIEPAQLCPIAHVRDVIPTRSDSAWNFWWGRPSPPLDFSGLRGGGDNHFEGAGTQGLHHVGWGRAVSDNDVGRIQIAQGQHRLASELRMVQAENHFL